MSKKINLDTELNKNHLIISREYLEMGGVKMTDKQWEFFCHILVNKTVLDLYEEIVFEGQ
jgi:hypothetical protein